jgi:hypothetical protein
MSASSSDFVSSSVSPKYIHPLVDEMVMSMQYLDDTTPVLGGDVPSKHVFS